MTGRTTPRVVLSTPAHRPFHTRRQLFCWLLTGALLCAGPLERAVAQGPQDAGQPRVQITDDYAELSNGIYLAAIDLRHPAIHVLRYSPQANWQFLPNLFTPDSNGLHGIVTRIGKGVIDSPASNYSATTAHAQASIRPGIVTISVSDISVNDPSGKNVVAKESWQLTLAEGNPEGVVWDRTVSFHDPTDLGYPLVDGGDTGSPQWVDAVVLTHSNRDLESGDYLPLITQIGGDVPATVYTSLTGALPGGKSLQAGQIIANALRGLHPAGEEVHLRYRLRAVDVRQWFSGLPADDRRAALHALWYGQVSKWWRGSVLTPGLKSLDATTRNGRWLSLDDSLPLAASLWSPYHALGGDLLWWENYDQWALLGQGSDESDLTGEQPETGFMSFRISDAGGPSASRGFLEGPEASTASFPIDVERLYAFTKDRLQLGRLMARLRLAHRYIESHPQGLFYQGAALQSLAHLYQEARDPDGLSRAQNELADWKAKLAAQWNRDWLTRQDYRELTGMADDDLLTPDQQKDLRALIEQYRDSEVPPASRFLAHPRAGGDYATGLFATVFRARMGDADRAYEMANAFVQRILTSPQEPYESFDADGKATGQSGYGSGSALDGIYAWGLFGFEPSTVDNLFDLQPSLPARWDGQPVSYSYEYAIDADMPNTSITVAYTKHAGDVDCLLTFGGLRPGQHRLQLDAGGAPIVVAGTLQGADTVFHVSLKNGTRYHFKFLPSVARPGVQLQTIRAAAAGQGTTLGPDQTIGVLEGALAGDADIPSCGINWDAGTPPGSFVETYLSNDGGTTWERVANGEWHVFAKAGRNLRYRLVLVRGKAEDLRVHAITATVPMDHPLTGAALPATADAVATGGQPAFEETFDGGLDRASDHDGNLHAYHDDRGFILGPGSLRVEGTPGNGYGSVWLARGIDYDPTADPYLELWIRAHSTSYTAIWVDLADTGLQRDGLAYVLPDGRHVTPLLVVTSGGPLPDNLKTLGDLQVVADGRRQHVSFNLGDALGRLFGPGPHRVQGLRLVNYVSPAGCDLLFDDIAARPQPTTGL